eukprot:Rhum_TRINITY_DN18521_c0_g1::Rhum_TRINITY_DN18521_c0_g1_i1::g.167534::m.167534
MTPGEKLLLRSVDDHRHRHKIEGFRRPFPDHGGACLLRVKLQQQQKTEHLVRCDGRKKVKHGMEVHPLDERTLRRRILPDKAVAAVNLLREPQTKEGKGVHSSPADSEEFLVSLVGGNHPAVGRMHRGVVRRENGQQRGERIHDDEGVEPEQEVHYSRDYGPHSNGQRHAVPRAVPAVRHNDGGQEDAGTPHHWQLVKKLSTAQKRAVEQSAAHADDHHNEGGSVQRRATLPLHCLPQHEEPHERNRYAGQRVKELRDVEGHDVVALAPVHRSGGIAPEPGVVTLHFTRTRGVNEVQIL